MVGSPMADADLYETDFYLWTQTQAEALRAAAKAGGRSNALEWERLAEEVGDLGKNGLRECFSRVRLILQHLIKLEASAIAAPRGGWRATIKSQRADLKRVLTATLRARVGEALEDLHLEAYDIAVAELDAHEPGVPPLNTARRWRLEQILGEADDPLA